MDCNSYSATAPGFGVDAPHQYTPVDTVTIIRKLSATGREYFTIKSGDSWTTAHDLQTAIWTAEDWLTEGV